jgi:hypothetical protein
MAGRENTLQSNGTITTKHPVRSSKVSLETCAHINEVLKRERTYRDAETQPRFYSKALGDDSFAAASLWLERTRWQITYKNVRRDILQAMARLPKISSLGTDYILRQGPFEGDPDLKISTKDKEKISCFLSAADAMLDRCELTAQNMSRVLLCWLASSRLDMYQAKPFTLKVEQNTRKRYRPLWKRFIAFTLRACLLPGVIKKEKLKIRLDARIASQINRLWEHHAWQHIDMTKPSWPRPHRLDHGSDNPRTYNFTDIKVNLSSRFESPYSNDADSISGEESSGDCGDSEREDNLDDWMSDMDSRDAPDASSSCRDSGHGSVNGITVESTEEFLKLLFDVSLSLTMESFVDGQPDSALLVYFSGILDFSSDCRRFQLAREYCPNLSGLIWVQRLLFLEYALPLHSYPTQELSAETHCVSCFLPITV